MESCSQENPGEIKSWEVELDSQENPGEIKRKEVELDSQENPGTIKRTCSWAPIVKLFYNSAVPSRTLSL